MHTGESEEEALSPFSVSDSLSQSGGSLMKGWCLVADHILPELKRYLCVCEDTFYHLMSSTQRQKQLKF